MSGLSAPGARVRARRAGLVGPAGSAARTGGPCAAAAVSLAKDRSPALARASADRGVAADDRARADMESLMFWSPHTPGLDFLAKQGRWAEERKELEK